MMKNIRACLAVTVLALSSLGLGACQRGSQHPAASSDLQIEKVVLYRNGVGYFDHVGVVEAGKLSLRVPREHLNDILKSLTVVDPHGQVLRVSMPLDEAAFTHKDAFAQDQLHETLRALRGTPVQLKLRRAFDAQISGRIFMVEDLAPTMPDMEEGEILEERDFRVSLMQESGIVSARLSEVEGIFFLDRGIRLSLNRALDSSSGQGSLQLVDVDIFLSESAPRQVSVSYVVEAPIWKPTYRVVIPGDGMNQVLLQGWAVVHNMSGDDWNDVQLSLAAGAPIAFRYDMHRPSRATREDLSWMQRQQQAEVAIGDSSFEAAPKMDETIGGDVAEEADLEESPMDEGALNKATAMKQRAPAKAPQARPREPRLEPRPTMPDLSRSVPASRPSSQLAGLTKISLGHRLSIPQGRSSMLAFVNERVPGKAALLFRAGGAGPGYENHPYRVLRFRNETPLLLESGPISLYAGGTFVGEGIAEAIGSGAWATIPYAVETDVEIVSDVVEEDSPLRVMRISGGVLEVEQFSQTKLTWRVQGPPSPEARSVYIDQKKSGPRYELMSPSPKSSKVEVFPDFYRLHLEVPANQRRASLDVVEKTPSRFSLSIWDGRALELLEYALSTNKISPAARAKLAPVVQLRRKLGAIDTKLSSLNRQRSDLEFQADQLRRNLKAIAKDRAAKELRRKLSEQLAARSQQIDAVGREVVTLRNDRLNTRLELEKIIQRLDLALEPGKAVVKGAEPEPVPAGGAHPNAKPEYPVKTTQMPAQAPKKQ